jgi:hypothetical protein
MASLNPAPVFAEEPVEKTPDYTLFDDTAVSIATFFGTPVVGTALMAVNYRRLGQKQNAILSIIAGVAGTVLSAFIAFKFAQGWVIPLVLWGATRQAAKNLQGKAIHDHLYRGGALASSWKAFAWSLTVFVPLAAIVALGMWSTATQSQKVLIGKDEVYYSGGATKESAQSLGEALKSDGFFQDRGVSVLLAKEAGATTLSFVIKDGMNNDGTVSIFQAITRQVAPSVGGLPVRLRLVNNKLATQTEVMVN